RAGRLHQRCGLGDRHAVRDGQELTLRDRDQFGVAAPAQQRAHLVPGLPAGDVRADRADPAGALHSGIGRGAGRRWVATLALHGISAVDPGRGHLHHGLTRPWHGIGDLLQAKDLRAAGSGDDDGTHASSWWQFVSGGVLPVSGWPRLRLEALVRAFGHAILLLMRAEGNDLGRSRPGPDGRRRTRPTRAPDVWAWGRWRLARG